MPEAIKPFLALLGTLLVLGVVMAAGKSDTGFTFTPAASSSGQPLQTTTTSSTTTVVTSTVAPRSESISPQSRASAMRVSRALFDGVNRERRTRGQAQLVWDDALAAQAQQWSDQLALSGQLEHRDMSGGPSSIAPGLSVFGENLFRSRSPVAALNVHEAWMQSDEHRQNILQAGYDRVGIGVVCAADGSVWATQEFGGGKGAQLTTKMPPAQPAAWTTGPGPTCN